MVFENPLQLGPYLLLAVCMILLAAVYTRSFYGFTHLFHRLQVPRWLKPAVGAFLMGAVALAIYFGFRIFGYGNEYVLSVLSFGYGSLARRFERLPSAAHEQSSADRRCRFDGCGVRQDHDDRLDDWQRRFRRRLQPVHCDRRLRRRRIGLGVEGRTNEPRLSSVAPEPAAFALVGMAGFFAAAAKTPFSILVIVSEMTGNYNLILPCCFVCTIAFLFLGPAIALSKSGHEPVAVARSSRSLRPRRAGGVAGAAVP